MNEGEERKYKQKISGRRVIIKARFHPDRKPPQTEYWVSGKLKGTHIPEGCGGVIADIISPEMLLKRLRVEIKDMMYKPPTQPNIIEEG
jgi:hypothetical protein